MSSSKSSQATNQTDNRRVIGEGGVSAEGSNVNSGGGILAQNGAQVSVLDNGAINRAFDFSQTVGAQALDFVKASQGQVADAYQEAKGRGVLTDWITIGAIAMAGLVAIQVAKR
ncbi:hypothetical protein [Hydrogenophaga intermedia]|uniref:hypothetical protein n=1 Tax=Hydrogenophaga intermedia TaxID=65786 RepID=UPI0020434C7D|nr:hypothetical protein [Hydrogenophaga intermedia]MCM3565926.1 hypothetical protein [Hydrogenophaga intermedia]